jgi:hypothetical protein
MMNDILSSPLIGKNKKDVVIPLITYQVHLLDRQAEVVHAFQLKTISLINAIQLAHIIIVNKVHDSNLIVLDDYQILVFKYEV